MSSSRILNVQSSTQKVVALKRTCIVRLRTESRHQILHTKLEVGKEPESVSSILILRVAHRTVVCRLGCPSPQQQCESLGPFIAFLSIMDCDALRLQADAELCHTWLKDVATLQRHERDLLA